MLEQPIGITFLPSEESAAMGPRRGNLEGDLGSAFKILSLRLPRVVGARSITPQSNLTSPGAAGVMGPGGVGPGGVGPGGVGPGGVGPGGGTGGFNPYAAVFESLLKNLMSQGGGAAGGSVGAGTRATRVIPGSGSPPVFGGGPAWIQDGNGNWVRPPGWAPDPMRPMPGPGVPTFPETGGGPFVDRSHPGTGARGSDGDLVFPYQHRGPLTRDAGY